MFTHRLFALAAMIFLVGAVASAQQHGMKRNAAADTTSVAAAVYTCPMHPKVTSSKPGECPECGMDLVLQKQKGGKARAAAADTSTYVCPMHPKVTSSKAGECPECGMDLVKQKSKPGAGKSESSMCDDCAGHGMKKDGHSKPVKPDSTKHH